MDGADFSMNHRSHKQRKDLIGEHGFGDAGQLIFAGLFFTVWIADSFFIRATTFLNETIPLWLRLPAGIILAVAAAYLSKTGLSIVFVEEREKPELIRASVFALVRHPVYLGEILVYFACLMFSVSLAAAAVWIAAILFLHYISRHEEKLLIDYFGEEYRAYMKEVPMWIPRISLGRRPARG